MKSYKTFYVEQWKCCVTKKVKNLFVELVNYAYSLRSKGNNNEILKDKQIDGGRRGGEGRWE